MKIRIDGVDCDPNARLTNVEAIALEKVSGLTVVAYSKGIKSGSALAFTGLLWLQLRRNGERPSFDRLEFDMNECRTIDDDGAVLEAAFDDNGELILDDQGREVMRRPDGELVYPKARTAQATGS